MKKAPIYLIIGILIMATALAYNATSQSYSIRSTVSGASSNATSTNYIEDQIVLPFLLNTSTTNYYVRVGFGQQTIRNNNIAPQTTQTTTSGTAGSSSSSNNKTLLIPAPKATISTYTDFKDFALQGVEKFMACTDITINEQDQCIFNALPIILIFILLAIILSLLYIWLLEDSEWYIAVAIIQAAMISIVIVFLM